MVYNNYTKFEKNEIVSKMNFREKKYTARQMDMVIPV